MSYELIRCTRERLELAAMLNKLERATRLACRKQTTTSRPEHVKAARNAALDMADEARNLLRRVIGQ